ncbi:hypothetical protein [Actinokineospora bangkokensis]|uniref:Uncharacterized protein n=1 Tax=Actinokineospora bangkokensis TaxID=1193682 RepID=A0A1Q9LDI2_9PSEU|nr:hypothetical protein [Actinokineospora bangkokensis]OLR90073.1 hypothetical protein BJP25_03600 [Actinokineospora bangkokensis]
MVTDGLVVVFERHVRRGISALTAIGYTPRTFIHLVEEHGAVGATRRLVLDPAPSYGLWRLMELGQIGRSVELATLFPWYEPLFDDVVRDAAWRKLELLGVDVPAVVALGEDPLLAGA